MLPYALQVEGPNELTRSFLMTAGAGSGKTGALVAATRFLISRRRQQFLPLRSKVAVITFTKAAASEVQRRVSSEDLAAVSTIHSFAWRVISPLTKDLREWRKSQLSSEIAELRAKELKGRTGTSASAQRIRSIAKKEQALNALSDVARFTYSPDAPRSDGSSLDHSEVLAAFAHLCRTKSLFRQMLAAKYPVVFVDEVQDTRLDVLEALVTVANDEDAKLQLGLFGDPMQRIYLDGSPQLLDQIPDDWDRVTLPMNYRSSPRIVRLLNELRVGQDDVRQVAATADEGHIRLFVENSSNQSNVAERMAQEWLSVVQEPKVLILEHALAAARLGFDQFVSPFDDARAALRAELFTTDSPAWPSIRFVRDVITPLRTAAVKEDRTAVTRIIKDALQSRTGRASSIDEVRTRALDIYSIFRSDELDSTIAVKTIVHSGLFLVPQLLVDAVYSDSLDVGPTSDEEDDETLRVLLWRAALAEPLTSLIGLAEYTSGLSTVDTQQGTKGLEYETVLALLDDSAARGTLFKFGKLFGTSPLSKVDEDHILNGRDNVVARTLRLFYVACSRARRRLAVVVRTEDPELTAAAAISNGWFDASEVARY